MYKATHRIRLVQELDAPEETVRTPDEAYLLLKDMQEEVQENLVVVSISTRNEVLAIETVYKGNLHQIPVRMAEVFRSAILSNACCIIVAHNHPSGDPTPSPEDLARTREMVHAGDLLGIEVLDHIVIGRGRYISCK